MPVSGSRRRPPSVAEVLPELTADTRGARRGTARRCGQGSPRRVVESRRHRQAPRRWRCDGAPGTDAPRRACPPQGTRPATERILVMSIDSATVSGGRIPGSRRAIIVLPDPGGPINRRLWPPAAAISSARFANCCPRTSQRSGWRVAGRSRRSRASSRVGPIVLVPERCSNTSPRVSPPRISTPSTAPASRAFAFGSRSLFTPRARHPAAIGSPPRIGLRCPSNPSSPTRQVPSTALLWHHSHPDQDRHGNREVEGAALLGHIGRSKVDGDPPRRDSMSDVAQGGGDPFPTLSNGTMGQADHDERGEANRKCWLPPTLNGSRPRRPKQNRPAPAWTPPLRDLTSPEGARGPMLNKVEGPVHAGTGLG